jgi:hypothetical protein
MQRLYTILDKKRTHHLELQDETRNQILELKFSISISISIFQFKYGTINYMFCRSRIGKLIWSIPTIQKNLSIV